MKASKFVCVLLVCIFHLCVHSNASQATKQPCVKTMLRQGEKLLKSPHPKLQEKGMGFILKAHQLNPRNFDALVAATKAYFLKAATAKQSKEIMEWAKQGWHMAERIIQRWPEKAEGYYWASVNIGQYARGGGVFVAINQGLAGKIEKMALASIKQNPKLYKGGAQRVLGRFYYQLPWPMRKLDKSQQYLEFAYSLEPKNIPGVYFLAETLLAKGQKARAKQLFQQCTKISNANPSERSFFKQCKRWVAKNP